MGKNIVPNTTGTGGGMGNEAWYQSRRFWGAIVAGVAAVLIQLGYEDIGTIATTLSGILVGYSFAKPK